MPHLKNKLIRNALKKSKTATEADNIKIEPAEEDLHSNIKVTQVQTNVPIYQQKHSSAKTIKPSNLSQAKKSANSAKNIVKNFARAMVNFAISRMAIPYIELKLVEFKLDLKAFQKYLIERRENMDGISSLRSLLLVTDDDDGQTASIKLLFQYTSEIFVKFFSVNWIFNSKLGDKLVHVKSRFKILRRIRNPEYFTYFKL